MLLSKASGRWRGPTQDSDCKVNSLDWLAFLPEYWDGCSREFSIPTPEEFPETLSINEDTPLRLRAPEISLWESRETPDKLL